MAKAPRAGQVKTRLCPPFSPEEAAELYRCFLRDLGRRLKKAEDLRVLLYHSPDEAGPELATLLGVDCSLHPQKGLGLGARMATAFAEVLATEQAAIMVGTDIPDLPLDRIGEAASLLQTEADVVLGPDHDGGYYLIGMRVAVPEAFDLPMSTGSLYEATRSCLEARGLKVAELGEWGDVDNVDDLTAFRRRLSQRGDREEWASWRALSGPLGRLLVDSGEV